ncbi:hypothetical protein FB451DRAFT_1478426 [Mycena latifolia]|nr:hypothetical protein FB451DRAFT_1478426 [Mycena latifolia]
MSDSFGKTARSVSLQILQLDLGSRGIEQDVNEFEMRALEGRKDARSRRSKPFDSARAESTRDFSLVSARDAFVFLLAESPPPGTGLRCIHTKERLPPPNQASPRDLSVLARCMPTDLWVITESNDGYGSTHLQIRLQRPMDASDWDRPSFYCHRVKSFEMDLSSFFEDTYFLETLGLASPTQFIFPNLHKLRWYPSPPESFHHLRLFLAPGIQDLRLGGFGTISHLSILFNLTIKCPSLRSVEILIHSLQDVAVPIVSTFVRSLVRIESLAIPTLDETAFAHLARLPALKSLEFHSPRTLHSFLQPSAGSAYFPALTQLTAPAMECGAALVGMLPNRPLVTLRIFGNSFHPTHYGSTILFRSSEIDPSANAPTSDQINMYCVRGDMLLPLFSFANLVSVTLVHPVGFDLDDAIVLGMAHAWSRIESLALLAGSFRHVHPRVTLEGLSAFAEHCPRLRSLSMTLDATMVPKLRGNDKKPRVTQESLTCVDVYLSLISKPGRVAVFLSAIFPELRWISTSYDERLDEMEEDDADEPIVEQEVVDSHVLWKAVEDALQQ